MFECRNHSYTSFAMGSDCKSLLQGHSVDDFALKKAGSVTALDWHPLKKAVACGWESGDVAVYSLLLSNLSIVKPLHKHPVSVILWTSSGTRLVTGDKVIWLFIYN